MSMFLLEEVNGRGRRRSCSALRFSNQVQVSKREQQRLMDGLVYNFLACIWIGVNIKIYVFFVAASK